ncbi:hypothetical protein BD289DRAFT_492428 [Coniella lustricola]|uniref:Chromo domain-containing protein n=1 Tax=Coniella lustricola TaxID=2025994 RepID=A0A2T3AGU2_9PEZI|nr:hypothetical protein BD289DRAFT_492428 [Coniella lustricola]
MPPAISDDDMSDVGITSDLLPPRKKQQRKSYEEVPEEDLKEASSEDEKLPSVQTTKTMKNFNGDEEAEEDDEEEEDMDEDEFVVEKIFSHYVEAGQAKFEVKWEGWPKKADRTWEDEDNLKQNASEVLQEYFARIGGREKMFEDTNKALASRKRGRQPDSSTSAEAAKRTKKSNGHPLDSTPPASVKLAQWKPPSGSWEDHVESVDMCQDEENGGFIVYLTWKNGKKTQHPKEVVYRRCPQKMLRFFERHIRISRDGGEPVPIGSVSQ